MKDKILQFTLLACLFGGCKSVHESLDEQFTRVEQIYSETYDESKIRKSKTIGWQEALAMMMENNLELHRAKDSLEQATESKEQVYWDLIPTLRLSTSISKALSEVGQISSEDLRFSVFSTVNIPGIINLYSRKYAALLAEIKARYDLGLKKRQLTIRLRELFLEYSAFETRKSNVLKSQLWNNKGETKPADFLIKSPEEILTEQQVFNLKILENQLTQTICKILGNFDFDWKLDSSKIPSLNYVEAPLDLNNTKQIGVLLRQTQAADLEAIRLSEFSTKLQYFPDLNFGVSSPPIYQVSNGNESSFSAENLILRASSSVSIDTSLRVTRQIKNVKRQIEFQNRFMKEEIRIQFQRALLAQQEIQLVEKELNLAQLRIEILNNQPRSSEMNQMRIFLEIRFVLIERISNLQARKARLEGGFWLLDESAWQQKNIGDKVSNK